MSATSHGPRAHDDARDAEQQSGHEFTIAPLPAPRFDLRADSG
jgi:hypothetical protein